MRDRRRLPMFGRSLRSILSWRPLRSISSWRSLRWLAQVALAVVAVWLTVRLLSSIGWAPIASRMAAADRAALTAAFAVLLARFAFWDARFRLAARRLLGPVGGPWLGFFALLASAALNLITPSARVLGGIMRARFFARASRRPFGLLYGVVLFDQVAHHTVMLGATAVSIAATALTFSRRGLGSPGPRFWAGLAAAALALAALAALPWLVRRAGSYRPAPPAVPRELNLRNPSSEEAPASAGGRWRELLAAHGKEAAAAFARLLGDRSLRLPAVAFGLGYFFANAAAQWLVFLALGERVEPLTVVTVVALGNAAGVFAGTPGGAGTTEAAMVPLYVLLGVGTGAAGAGTLVFRALHYAGVLAVGLPALAALELRAGPGGEAPRLGGERGQRGERMDEREPNGL